ncbi:hypothetical protein, partial [Klebsiella pneumoniae]|uniref:hypothetical protein n=1 Tax=Klebsiella pneumoniae TaxID=573 RepID=UPI001D0D9383
MMISTAHWSQVLGGTAETSTGNVAVRSADANIGNSGAVNILTGASEFSDAGAVRVVPGSSTAGAGANV